jgi:hypothetical protein
MANAGRAGPSILHASDEDLSLGTPAPVGTATFAPYEQAAGDTGKMDKNSRLARMRASASQQVSPGFIGERDPRRRVRLFEMTGI